MEKDALESKFETAYKGIQAVQARMTEFGEKLDKIDTDVIDKASFDATTALTAVQEIKAKERFDTMQAEISAIGEQIKDLEVHMAKGGGDANAVKSAIAGLNPEGKLAKMIIDRVAPHDPEARKAMTLYLRHGEKKHAVPDEIIERIARDYAEKHLIGVTDEVVAMQVKDLVAGSGPDGGYFLTTDRSNRLVERIFETSPIRASASIETTTADTWEIILDDDEPDSGWVGEVQARPDTETPNIGLKKIAVHEIYAQPTATQKMLDDAGFDIEAWLSRKVASRFARQENLAFVLGDGAQRPRGFLTYPNWTTPGTYQRNAVERVQAVGGTGAGAFDADDLIELKHALIEDYQAAAIWGMNRQTFTEVMKLKNSEGNYLLNFQLLLQGVTEMLLGSDVMFFNDMPVPAASSLSIICGDFSEFYTIVDRFGIRILRDPYTRKPYIRFYTTKRVGGDVTNYEAAKILITKAS